MSGLRADLALQDRWMTEANKILADHGCALSDVFQTRIRRGPQWQGQLTLRSGRPGGTARTELQRALAGVGGRWVFLGHVVPDQAGTDELRWQIIDLVVWRANPQIAGSRENNRDGTSFVAFRVLDYPSAITHAEWLSPRAQRNRELAQKREAEAAQAEQHAREARELQALLAELPDEPAPEKPAIETPETVVYCGNCERYDPPSVCAQCRQVTDVLCDCNGFVRRCGVCGHEKADKQAAKAARAARAAEKQAAKQAAREAKEAASLAEIAAAQAAIEIAFEVAGAMTPDEMRADLEGVRGRVLARERGRKSQRKARGVAKKVDPVVETPPSADDVSAQATFAEAQAFADEATEQAVDRMFVELGLEPLS